VHADKEPEPLNLGVPVVNFPRANAILAREQALLWVRDWYGAGGGDSKIYCIYCTIRTESSLSAAKISHNGRE
jgi:hypothetical protein